ncbi:STAS domain-containing protein [Aphelenchoides besseyi]|nr:STAS domain-containing protein [Aphelenchoides besseyi]
MGFRLGIGVAFELFTVVARSQWPRWRVTFLKKTETADVCAFQFEAMLLFTNAERRVLKKWNQKFANSEDQQIQRTFIFDCSGITDVDAVGMVSFGEVVKELRHNGCVVYFSGCPESLIPKLQEVNAWQSEKEVFPTLSDATLQARLNQYEMGNMGSFSRENPRRSISVQYSV